MDAKERATVVVMESGSAWPAWIEQCRPTQDTRVIVQHDGDAPGDLADRVIGRVESLVSRGIGVGIAVVACGERTDDSVLSARRSVVSSILSAMAATARPGRLLLSASQRSSGSARRALSTLAADLNDEWESAGIQVSVRFGTQARPPQELAASQSVPPEARHVA